MALEEGGDTVPFAELDRRTRQAVALLSDLGVAKGVRAWLRARHWQGANGR